MPSNSSVVDERVVEMRIDNAKFEAGAKKTIGILEELDKGLQNLGKQHADGFDEIGNSLDKVTDRFSTMGIIGDQILRNLTNKAMELVGQFKNMATTLTTQQVGAGWNKYADKTQAIQTIMAATSGKIEEGYFADQAEQLEWVNEQIQKLNKFTDETSYNFLDMVGNIGKFTAAGRELEESVTAMEGIANWAAISGGRPAEASRAMYNLSQALGMGAVTTIDWKSIENANMATYEFKKQAIETAVEVGTLRKVTEGLWETVEGGYEVTVENFRNSLSFGRGTDAIHWFNGDVLLSVLNRYGEFSDILIKTVNEFEDLGITVTDYLKILKAFKNGGLEEVRKEFDLTDKKIEALLPSLEELSKAEYDLGFRAFQAAQEAKTFTEAIDATKDAVSTKWMDVFELLFGNYLEAKELWTQMAEVFWDIFASPVDHLIDIIKGAGGIFDKDGILRSFTEGLVETAGGTAVLEDRLSAVGKSMDDFHKALNKALGPKEVKRIVDDYGSLEEALINGAITSEQFKKALGELDDAYDTKSTVSLNRALNKAGKTMSDFQKAIEKTGDAAALDLIENFGGVEEALKRGGISAELFKKALESLGIDAENVSENVEESAVAAVASLEEMRQYALEVLRGDHGNGDERLAWYESMGLDPELMQAMAGDLKNFGYYISDEALMEYMEQYYQAQNLAARLGYETFAEYMASIVSSTDEMVYDMNQMADEADDIYASLFGEGVLDSAGEYVSAGELFRKSLSNLLEALDNFGTAFDEAFMKVFGGEGEYEDQIGRLSDGFFTLTAAFYSFSERVKAFSESETFMNFMTAFFSVLRLIGKALGLVFKIAKIGLSFVMKLLSPILTLATGIFETVSTGIDAVSRSIEDAGIIQMIDTLGNTLLSKIAGPIDKINYVITRLIQAFRDGFESGGGIAGGLRNMSEAIDQLFENHPIFLTVVHALARAFIFLKDALEGLALVFGSIFGGAIMLVISGFQKLGEWFGQFVTWARDSELVSGAWHALTSTFEKFGRVIKRVFGYAEEGYREGGFVGALTAVADSFERGVKRLVPGGEKLVEIFNTVKDAIKGLFTKKKVNENGVEEIVDETDNAILRLEETADKITTITRDIGDGAFGDENQQAGFRDRVRQFVSNLWQGFLEGLRDIRVGDVINALRLGVIADIALKVGHGLNIFNQLGENIREIPENLSWSIENIALMFKSLAVDFKANAIIKFAAAAAIVAGAIWILSRIPDKNLEKASSIVIAILSVLSLLALALSKTSASIFQTIQYMPALGAALIGFAMLVSSIGMTALTLALVAKFVGTSELSTAAATVGMLLTIIAAMLVTIILLVRHSQFNMEQMRALGSVFKSIGLAMMGVALAVQMLVLPILAFSAVLKFVRGGAGLKKFWMAVGAVGAIMAAIAVLVWVITASVNGYTAEQISQLGNFLIKVAASMVIIAFALNMLVMPLLLLAAAQKLLKLDINGIIGSVVILGLIGALIAVILAAFGSGMANKDTAKIQAVGNMLIKLAASLAIIAVALAIMAKPIIKIAELCNLMSDWHVIKSLGILLGTIGILALILGLLSKVVLKGKGGANSLGLGKGLMRIAEGILLLSLAALVLTPAIIALAAAIGIFTAILGSMDDQHWEIFETGLERLGKFSKKLILFGAALSIIGVGAVLTGAGVITFAGAILVLAAAMAIIIVALPKFIDMLKGLKDTSMNDLWNSIRKVGLALLIFGVVLGAILLSLNRLFRLMDGKTFRLIGEGFVRTIKSIASGMRTGISNGFTSVIEFLKNKENKEKILAVLESLILVGAAYVAGILPTVAHVVIGGLVGLLNAVAAEISAQAPEIVDAINNIINAIIKLGAGLIDSAIGTNFLTKLTESEQALNNVRHAVELLGIVFGGLKLVGGFKSLLTKLKGAGGVIESLGKTSAVASQVDEAMLALSGSSSGYFSSLLPMLGTVAAAAAVVAGAIWYANKNINEQQDILEERAFDGQEKSIEGYNAAIADTEKRMGELKTALDNGDTSFMTQDEYNALNLLLGTLIQEREELERQTAAMNEAANASVSFETGIHNVRDAMSLLNSVDLSQYGYTVEQINHMDDAQVVATARAIEQELGTAWDSASVKAQEAAASEQVLAAETENAETKIEGFKISVSSLGDKFDEFKAKFAEHGFNINDYISGDTLDLSSFISPDIDTDITSWFQNTISGSGGDMSTIFSNMMDGVGADGIAGVQAGWDRMLPGWLSELFDFGDKSEKPMREGLESNSPSEKFARVGDDIVAGLRDGVNRSSGMATDAMTTLSGNVVNAFGNLKTAFQNSGVQIVQGLINGISANMLAVYNTGVNLAASVENGFKQRLRIQSPSKVFNELGGYITEGVSEGVSNGQDGAIDSIVILGDALVQAISKSMAEVGYIASEDFDISPHITPVVDMSNVTAASGSIGSLLGGSYRSYVDSVNSRAANISNATQSAAMESRVNNEATLGEMRAMGNRIDALGQAITNMQIVLDSGALVGATSARMDNQLGRISARRARAN